MITSFFRTAGLCLVVALSGQSCDNTNDNQQQSSMYVTSTENANLDACQSYGQKSLALFDKNVPSMVGLVRKIDAGYDPSGLDIFSALSFAIQVSEYEEQIKKECPETFAAYEEDRNTLLALHGISELAQYFATLK